MFSRSLRLARASWSVIRAQRELLMLPVVSFFTILLSLAAVGVPAYLAVLVAGGSDTLMWVAGAVLTYVAVAVALFFQTAMVAAAHDHMDGRDPTLGSSLSKAVSLLPQILGWSLVVTFVKLVLRWLRDRGTLGDLLANLADAAFTFATYITVPVLVAERLGPIAALKRSANLLRKTWGENIIGRVGISAVTFLLMLGAIAVGVAGGFVAATVSVGLGIGVVAVAVLGIVCVVVLSTALNAVYQTALYRYAVGASVEGFGEVDLVLAFRRKATMY